MLWYQVNALGFIYSMQSKIIKKKQILQTAIYSLNNSLSSQWIFSRRTNVSNPRPFRFNSFEFREKEKKKTKPNNFQISSSLFSNSDGRWSCSSFCLPSASSVAAALPIPSPASWTCWPPWSWPSLPTASRAAASTESSTMKVVVPNNNFLPSFLDQMWPQSNCSTWWRNITKLYFNRASLIRCQ